MGFARNQPFLRAELRLHLQRSETHFRGPSEVAGVYAQGGAGAAVGRGAQAVIFANQSGAVLTLTGKQNGPIVSVDLRGLPLSLK